MSAPAGRSAPWLMHCTLAVVLCSCALAFYSLVLVIAKEQRWQVRIWGGAF